LIVHQATDIDIASECSCRLWGPAVDELLSDSTRNLCNIEHGLVMRGSSRACRSADVTLGPNLLHLVLLVFALPKIGGSFAGPNGLPFRLIAPEIAAACAGMLTGRAVAIAMRWRRAPHVDLHRL
jgi:hypothetical protein